MIDYDNPQVEAQWFAERRAEIIDYLKAEGIKHGSIGDEPDWYVAPYVSIWPVGSLVAPGKIGWWAICGDIPTDYVSSEKAKNPREAMKAIASLWKEAAGYMARGEQHPTFRIGNGEDDAELAPMLASRADTLLEWSANAEFWEEA